MHQFHPSASGAVLSNVPNPGWVLQAAEASLQLDEPCARELRDWFCREGDHLIPDSDAREGQRYEIVPVARFQGIAPERRPDLFCPVCRARVISHCGELLRPHYAHISNTSSCGASTGEGSLHLNGKLWILAQLRGSPRLSIRRLCAGVPRGRRITKCDRGQVAPWLSGWDDIHVEYTLPSVRADLLLTKHGRPIGAIEVRASHAVDATKVEALEALGVPWVEVDARDLFVEGKQWISSHPLPVRRTDREALQAWRCPEHAQKYADILSDRARVGVPWLTRVAHVFREELEEPGYAARKVVRLRSTRLVAMTSDVEGRPREIWLRNAATEEDVSPREQFNNLSDAHTTAERLYERWAATAGLHVESHMGWEPGTDGVRGLPYDTPSRVRLDGRHWIEAPNVPQTPWPWTTSGVAEWESHPVWGYSATWADKKPDGLVSYHAIRPGFWITIHPPAPERGAEAEGERETKSAAVELSAHDGRSWTIHGKRVVRVQGDHGEPQWGELIEPLASAVIDRAFRGYHDLIRRDVLTEALDYVLEPYQRIAGDLDSWSVSADRARPRTPSLRDPVCATAVLRAHVQGTVKYATLLRAPELVTKDAWSERAGDWVGIVARLKPWIGERWGIAFCVPDSIEQVTGALKRLEQHSKERIHPYWFCRPGEAAMYRQKLGPGYVVSLRQEGGPELLYAEVQGGRWIRLAEFIRAVIAYGKDAGGQRALRADCYRDSVAVAHNWAETRVPPAWALAYEGKACRLFVGRRLSQAGRPEMCWLPISRVHRCVRGSDDTIWIEVELAREGELPAPDDGEVLCACTQARRAVIHWTADQDDGTWTLRDLDVGPSGYPRLREQPPPVDRGMRDGPVLGVDLFQRMLHGRGRYALLDSLGVFTVVRGIDNVFVESNGRAGVQLIRNPSTEAPELASWEQQSGAKILRRERSLCRVLAVLELAESA